MAITIKQNSDGTTSFHSEADGYAVALLGGVASPTTGTTAKYRGQIYAQISVAGGTDTAGGLVAWLIPTTFTNGVLVNEAILNVTTGSSGACSVSIGTAANGTTSSANLIDTLSVASTGTFDNYTDKGTNGKSRQKLTSGQYITMSTASGASSGLVATLTIGFVPL